MRLIFLKMLVTAGFIGFWEDIRSYKIRPVPSNTMFHVKQGQGREAVFHVKQ